MPVFAGRAPRLGWGRRDGALAAGSDPVATSPAAGKVRGRGALGAASRAWGSRGGVARVGVSAGHPQLLGTAGAVKGRLG